MFELIDCATGHVYGPFHFLSEARAQAERFETWEIIDGDGQLVCERWPPPAQSDECVVAH